MCEVRLDFIIENRVSPEPHGCRGSKRSQGVGEDFQIAVAEKSEMENGKLAEALAKAQLEFTAVKKARVADLEEPTKCIGVAGKIQRTLGRQEC